jgi:hypothetical protein
MSEKKTTSQAVMGCAGVLACAALAFWIDLHVGNVAWNNVLRHYFPSLPVLTLWQIFAVSCAARYVFTDPPVVTPSGGSEMYAAKLVGSATFRWLVLWLIVRGGLP